MKWLNEIFDKKSYLVLAVFVLLHLAFLNINVAEWGDSYRILRASEFIRNLTYPEDEKRPPLFSFFLALRPDFIDPLVYGKVFMFVVSIAAFVVFTKLLSLSKINGKYKHLILILFAFNPVYFYWSLRIYADVFFSLIFMLALLTYLIEKNDRRKSIILGALCSFAVLTRFEGYLMGFSFGAYYLYKLFKKKDYSFLYFGFVSLFILSIWWLYRSPFESSYFEEPARRMFELKTAWTYIVSFVFSFGFIPLFSFFSIKKFKSIFTENNLPVLCFTVLQLFLALVWPAAIPRLFIPILPLFLLYVFDYETINKKIYVFLIILYGISQYTLGLQFLLRDKVTILSVLVLAIISFVFLILKKYRFFYTTIVVSTLFWSISIVFLHANLLKSSKLAAEFASKNAVGTVVYNDVSAISDWYLNYSPNRSNVMGKFLNLDEQENRTFKVLKEKNINYLLVTNEHNPDFVFDLKKRPFLVEIKEFRYNIENVSFYTKILKVDYEYKEY